MKNIRIEMTSKSVYFFTVDDMDNANAKDVLDYLVKEQLVDESQVVSYNLY